MSKLTKEQMAEKILQLKKEKSVYIIAHYYQRPEIQDIADFVGDSYAMAVAAKNSPLDTILVAGVDFMAESASSCARTRQYCPPSRRLPAPWLIASKWKMWRNIRAPIPTA